MIDEVSQLADDAVARAGACATVAELESLASEMLGKTGRLAELRAGLRDVDPADRKALGQALNDARQAVDDAVAQRREVLADAERRDRLTAERMDLTEVLGGGVVGHTHVLTQTREQLEDAFAGMGFTVAEGPEVESDWYNFEALNMPDGHPARSMFDTLYLDVGEPETILLRTHTSPVQIRTMMEQEPPIYIVAPGRTFRRDTADATHLPVFHQIEGLVVDRDITFADLAGTVEAFVKVLYGDERTTRLRPSFFPFTEPSAEFDMSTPDGSWMELGGCGLVHPNVLTACGLDPEEWSGFAFGFGIERMVAQRHGMSDIREFVLNDMRFLEQF